MDDESLVIEIDGVYVAEDIFNVYFLCDLEHCKGVCCTTDSASVGAPLTTKEQKVLQENQNRIQKYLPVNNQKVLQEKGIYERKDIRFFTSTMPESSKCTLAVQEQGCWQCVVQKKQDELKLQKPISCSLFPIREERGRDGKPILVMEYWNECERAYDYGYEEEVMVYEALKTGLVQRFGEGFYNKLDKLVKSGELDSLLERE